MTTQFHQTIGSELRIVAQKFPNRPALLAATSDTRLTYATLAGAVRSFSDQLRALGIGRDDRIAVVMPDGVPMAVTFLGCVDAATIAPLNSRYRAAEFAHYLASINPTVLLVEAGSKNEVRHAATDAEVPIIEVALDDWGAVTLSGESPYAPLCARAAGANDIALILHTSGTTSLPKMVPLRQANLCISARHIISSLQLSEADRLLSVMPLYHIHGLSGLLSTLLTGGSVVCTHGFSAPHFFQQVERCQPTWYTAVPTMHQAILTRAVEHAEIAEQTGLRLIRSSSASLTPAVMTALETVFGVPVIESYAMTEAASQITINPLPPLKRRPGTVGTAAGPQVAIMEIDGPNILHQGMTGEVVIRGLNVTTGYLNNPTANEAAFVNGWLRTGDQGFLDADGYLTLTGRIKELINRGGEKIAPREIDEALLSHPAVAQAVAFALPDEMLGEEIAAAVVCKAGIEVGAKDLQRHLATQLAYFKVPRRIFFVDTIPKGPTGKLQRIGLADQLDLAETSSTFAGRQVQEATIAFVQGLWCEILCLQSAAVDQRFLELGGDSLQATRLVNGIRHRLGIDISIIDFFDAPTIMDQARLIEELLRHEIQASTRGSIGAN